MTADFDDGSSSLNRNSTKPKIRWWLPGTAVSYDTLTSQLESVNKAGFGGVEVAFLGNGGGKPGLREADKWSDKDGKWKRMVEFIWKECERLDLSVDLTIGPAFPAMVPGLSPDEPGSAKELVYGVSSSYVPGERIKLDQLPTPTWKEAGRTPANPPQQTARLNLVAVYAVRVVVDDAGEVDKREGSMVIDSNGSDTYQTAVIDITQQAEDNTAFIPPDDSSPGRKWIVVAVYYRGTLQSKSHFEQNADTYTQDLAHVVDHLSEDGVNVLAKYYQDHILDAELMRTFKRMKSSLFEDSLELSQTQYWTPALLQEFKQRRGYDLIPYLPLILDAPKHHPFAPPFKTFKLSSTLEDGKRTLQDRVRYDFALTVSDLYLEKRLDPLKKWSNSIGLALRNQPYGIDCDAAVAATKVDIVEGETLCFWGNDDSFRVLATGRDVSGGKILSEELAASMHKHYAMTWHDIIRTANRDFALGVNQVIMHGLPYPETEHSEWPGYMPFMPAGKLPGFGDAWGERQPQWDLSAGYTNYLNNVQKILQKGRAIVDIAIYHSATEGVKGGLKEKTLTEAGYTYGFPSDGLLAREDAAVKDGQLWADGPGYKALILNDVRFITHATLERIVELAKQGLPVIVVGKISMESAGLRFGADGRAGPDDGRIHALLVDLEKMERCTRVCDVGEVPKVLENLCIRASIRCQDSLNPFMTACREDNTHRYYYIHNASDETVNSSVTIHAPQYTAPVALSLWDQGQATSVESVVDPDRNIQVVVHLASKGSAIIRLTRTEDVEDSLCANASHIASRLTIRQVEIKEWQVDLQSWEPTSDVKLSSITRVRKVFSLDDGVQSWLVDNGLEDTSGKAVYRATFQNSQEEMSLGKISVVLELGRIDDAHDLTINGEMVLNYDRLSGRPDITRYLRMGDNVLEITIGTTLNNRMKHVYPEVFKDRTRQRHGLEGPVRLMVYTNV